MAQRRGQSEIHNLSSLLDVLQRKVDDDQNNGSPDKVAIRDVLEVVGTRAYGPLLLVIGLVSVSPATIVPGATWTFAALTLLVAIQLALHKRTPWMPRKVLEMELSEQQLGKFIRATRSTAQSIDAIVKPRLEFLVRRPWTVLVAGLIVLAALITFPLGLVPVAPLLPGIAICLFGLGLTARDGFLLSLGALLVAGACWLLFGHLL